MISEQSGRRTRNVGVNGMSLLVDGSGGCASLPSSIKVLLSAELLAR